METTPTLSLELSYRELAEALPAMIAVSRPDGLLVYINKRWAAYTGMTLDELNAERRRIFHPDDYERVVQANGVARASGEPLDIDYRIRRHDGVYRWHSWRSTPVRDASGEIIRWVGTTMDVQDRVLAEQRLRANEQRWWSLAETMPAHVALANPRGRIEYVNERWRDYMGLDDMRAASREWVERIHPEDRERLGEAFTAAVQRNEPFEAETRVRGADGEYRWFLGRTAPVICEDGNVLWWIGVSIDINERKRMEEELRSRESEYRSLVDATPAIVCRAQPDGTLDYFNSQWYAYTGLDEIRGKADIVGMFHPDEAGFVLAAWSDALRTGEAYDIEYRARRHDGVYRWHFGRVAPVLDGAGTIVNWIASSVDIDERKRAEEGQRVLNEISEELSATLDYGATLDAIVRASVPSFADYCAIYTRQADGSIRRITARSEGPELELLAEHEINPAAKIGVAAVLATGNVEFWEEIPGAVLQDAASSPEHLEALQAAGFRSGIAIPVRIRGEIIAAMAFGVRRPGRTFRLNDVELATEIGRRAGLAIDGARLFAEMQAMLADLRRANDAKDEFLGLVSHELKTPITTIFGNAKVLHDKSDAIGRGDRDMALRDIAHEAQRLHSIIENLLVLARLERGQAIEREPLLIERFVERVVGDYIHSHSDRKVSITSEARNVPVLAEPGYVEQVLLNLLSNAEKYSPAGVPIDLSISRDDRDVAITVRDYGEGIDPGEADRIFEPFYRSPRLAARAQGFGIGLSVCRRLVEAQGGSICARPHPDAGSEFTFTLPLADDGVAAT